jgi:hypothetical protein
MTYGMSPYESAYSMNRVVSIIAVKTAPIRLTPGGGSWIGSRPSVFQGIPAFSNPKSAFRRNLGKDMIQSAARR